MAVLLDDLQNPVDPPIYDGLSPDDLDGPDGDTEWRFLDRVAVFVAVAVAVCLAIGATVAVLRALGYS